jgi:hypothetical protein
MTLTYETLSLVPGLYYKSFAGYQVRAKMEGPIRFDNTERLSSFCLVRHDNAGRLLWFAKIIVEKQSTLPWRAADQRPSDSLLFFEAKIGSAGIEVGSPLEYRATEHLNNYVQVKHRQAGSAGQAELLQRSVFFADLYAYGPRGKLRQRKLVRADESFSAWEYDDHGHVVAEAQEPCGGFSPEELS